MCLIALLLLSPCSVPDTMSMMARPPGADGAARALRASYRPAHADRGKSYVRPAGAHTVRAMARAYGWSLAHLTSQFKSFSPCASLPVPMRFPSACLPKTGLVPHAAESDPDVA